MKVFLALLWTLLTATAAVAAEGPEGTFKKFMHEFKEGSSRKAIRDYGIDERNDTSSFLRVPGDLTYKIKDTKGRDSDREATISAVIEYTRVTEKAGAVTDKAQTAGKVASGNVGGAAVNVGKNQAGDTLDRFSRNEKVRMRKVDGAWKVVVTDQLYDVLTGK